MNLSEIFKISFKELHSAGLESPHLEASWIIEKFTQLNAVQRIQFPELPISEAALEQIVCAVNRRKTGEPLAYILEEKQFYGLNFYVDKNVLIPRPETELLVDWALECVAKLQLKKAQVSILDLGCGSGCIGLALLSRTSNTRLTGIDISENTLQVARKNALAHNFQSRSLFINMDASDIHNLSEKFDLIVANPPYIDESDNEIEENVKRFEPHIALFSEQGLAHTRSWLGSTQQILADDCAIGFEVGHGLSDKVLDLFKNLDVLSKIYTIRDYANINRVVCGERIG